MGTGRGLRSESDPRSTFFAGAERKRQVVLAETEAVLTKLLQRLKKGEIPRRVLANYFVPCAGPVGCGKSCPRSGDRTFFNVNHRLALHSGRSIAYAAAWMGRLKTLQRLVCEFAAALDCEDDNGFTPLAVAAWAGHTKVVNWILSIGITLGDMDKKGVPPMTSSCGGKVLRPCISAQHGALFFFAAAQHGALFLTPVLHRAPSRLSSGCVGSACPGGKISRKASSKLGRQTTMAAPRRQACKRLGALAASLLPNKPPGSPYRPGFAVAG